MKTTRELTLDLSLPPDALPCVAVSQDDSMSRCVVLHLKSNGADWVLPKQYRAAIAYHKPDGTGGVFDTLPDGSPACYEHTDSSLSFVLAPQMMTCSGKVSCQLILTDDTHRLGSFRWMVEIREAVDHTIRSEDYFRFNTLTGLRQALDELEQELKDDLEQLRTDQAAWAEQLRAEDAEWADRLQAEHSAWVAQLRQMLVQMQDQTRQQFDAVEQNAERDRQTLAQMQDQTRQRFDALESDLDQLARKPGLAEDVSDTYASIIDSRGLPYPIEYLLTLPDGRYVLDREDGHYRAELVTVGNYRYAGITQYEDDGIVYLSRYMNGRLMEEWESVWQDEPLVGSTAGLAACPGQIEALTDRVEALEGAFNVENWADVQKIVRAGLAGRYFTVGDQLQCLWRGQTLTWDVIGIDHDTPADPQYEHSLTLQLHNVLDDRLCFDQAEPNSSNANYAVYGCNEWERSNLRQWLNTDGAGGDWFVPWTDDEAPWTEGEDEAPDYAAEDGFLRGMDEDFVAALGTVKKKTISGSGSVKTTEDTVFLLARCEIYGSTSAEGKAYAFYRDNSELSAPGNGNDLNRVRQNVSGNPVSWVLRTIASETSVCISLRTGGAIGSDRTNRVFGIAPAVCIV